MTPAEFKEARRKLGLSAAQLAAIYARDPRTIRRMEDPRNTRPITPADAALMRQMLAGERPEGWPERMDPRAGRTRA